LTNLANYHDLNLTKVNKKLLHGISQVNFSFISNQVDKHTSPHLPLFSLNPTASPPAGCYYLLLFGPARGYQRPPQPPPTISHTSHHIHLLLPSIKVSNPNLDPIGFDFYLSFDSCFVVLIIDHDVLIRIRTILDVTLDVMRYVGK